MNTLEAIAQRRSIRKFKDTPVPDELVEKVLSAAVQAPSGENRQPWRFYVVKEDKRAEMVRIMREGIEKREGEGMSPVSSKHTARIMEQAPVTIFVFNPFYEEDTERESAFTDVVFNVVDVQSVGAAIQNLLLAALEYDLGTLWICDVFYAYDELRAWLGETHQMVAAVLLGYPDQSPHARPRKPVGEVTRWL